MKKKYKECLFCGGKNTSNFSRCTKCRTMIAYNTSYYKGKKYDKETKRLLKE